MTKRYFDWMCHLVCNDQRERRRSRRKLLGYLHQRTFLWTFPMDKNRAMDGVDLRYRFAYENHLEKEELPDTRAGAPCSVLEMMIALAIRCEEHIMADPDIGNRTGEWFWEMIESLGLDQMTDDRFDEDEAKRVVDLFLDHSYAPGGEGGLFRTHSTNLDMRHAEIWYQMMWHLDEFLTD